MKILWITNQVFPVVSQYLGQAKTVIGGWTYSAAEEIKKLPNIELAVASLYMGNEFKEITLDGDRYYLIPCYGNKMKYNKSLEGHCKTISDSFMPDVVHIYGTEYPITLAYINACGSNNVVVSMQGVPALYTRYFFSGINLIDILKHPVMLLEKISFDRNNNIEKMALSKIKIFEGRSNWDHSVAWTYSPNCHYYHCNRTLRASFYQDSWDISRITRHSIFLSQAQYSIKGLHQVIKALPLILRLYSDTRVYVAGNSPFAHKGFKGFIKSLGYGGYVKNLIKKYKVGDYFEFLGSLNEHQMVDRYKKSHIFVCPSTIENVPNSVAEAQILGVPTIASYVGGDSTLIDENTNGLLYRFEEYEMLAKGICDIFESDELALKCSTNGRETALKRHNKERNMSALTAMYNDICLASK